MRYLFSTDARDIGILYLILAGFSGMLGTMMSLLIRLQLMDINQIEVLGLNGQVYNNIITIHALLMIFYLIMPALFGAFWQFIST
jgi:heme/copper-type cytochrome/quinol oxidase subunit 1